MRPPAFSSPPRLWVLAALLLGIFGTLRTLAAVPELVEDPGAGLRLARGFRIRQVADQQVANDIWSFTFDPRGRLVASGAGYIKVLGEPGADGAIHEAKLFARCAGAHGLCFDSSGRQLLAMTEGALVRYRDDDLDGVADGPAEKILPFASGEHGGHGIRQGPDGWWYVIGGNDAGINGRHVTTDHSPVKQPQAGGVVRLSPDLRTSEVVADGFRNPYRFDFSSAGEIFTYDSDTERDYFLPWYSGTRIYQVGVAQHHGWRLKGYQRSFRRPDYSPDTVPCLADLGRGSPTGVVCYRHTLLPARWQGGLFLGDWTFGKIWFMPLASEGAAQAGTPEVFLEPVGTQGFAPTDLAVGPDGAIYVSIGGRKTRGAIYRIAPETGAALPATPADYLSEVLRAPQPLEAWSRAHWMPIAEMLGADPLAKAVLDESRAIGERVRAVEVLTEIFGGLNAELARSAAQVAAPEVRARAAWSLGRKPGKEGAQILLDYLYRPNPAAAAQQARSERKAARADFSEPVVFLAALNALGARGLPKPLVDSPFAHKLGASELMGNQFVRLGLARVLTDSAGQWMAGASEMEDTRFDQLNALSRLLRPEVAGLERPAIEQLLAAQGRAPGGRYFADQARLFIRALGGERLENPSCEALAMYELAAPLEDVEMKNAILTEMRPLFPRGDGPCDTEISRLLAMLEDDDASVPPKVLGMIKAESAPTADFHFLAVFARLAGALPADADQLLASAILGLDAKLAHGDQRPKQNWPTRLAELVEVMTSRVPKLPHALLGDPRLITGGHLEFLSAFSSEEKTEAARLFLAEVRRNPGYSWTPGLVKLLDTLPAPEVRPLFRAQWTNLALRPDLRRALAHDPDPEDRERLAPPQPVRPEEAAKWDAILATVAWQSGDSARGAALFKDRGCALCHGGPTPFGPDLAPVAARLSPADLFRDIVFPSRSIAEAFKATQFQMRDGSIHLGLVAFGSADGVIIQTGPGATERLAESDIAARTPSEVSLMPEGLLTGLTREQLADLYAYLKSLAAPQPAAPVQ